MSPHELRAEAGRGRALARGLREAGRLAARGATADGRAVATGPFGQRLDHTIVGLRSQAHVVANAAEQVATHLEQRALALEEAERFVALRVAAAAAAVSSSTPSPPRWR